MAAKMKPRRLVFPLSSPAFLAILGLLFLWGTCFLFREDDENTRIDKRASLLLSSFASVDIWKRWGEEVEDPSLVLTTKTKHLQTEFFLANSNDMLGWVSSQQGELAVTEVFHHVLRKTQCSGLVLDVGANIGYYSMLSLSEGCQNVFIFEPQPGCIRRIAQGLIKNNFRHATIIPHLVDAISGTRTEFDPSTDCNGRWPVEQFEQGDLRGGKGETMVMESITLSEVIPQHVRISHAKVDTEGAEYAILLSMVPFLEKGLVDSVIFEMTPMWWDKYYGLTDKSKVIDGFLRLITRHGFNCRPLDRVPWFENDFYTKENVSSLAVRIAETYQTDFWFCKEDLCW